MQDAACRVADAARCVQVVPIHIPQLDAARLAQIMIIGAELAAAYGGLPPRLHAQLNCDTQIAFATAGAFSALDLLEVLHLAAGLV